MVNIHPVVFTLKLVEDKYKESVIDISNKAI